MDPALDKVSFIVGQTLGMCICVRQESTFLFRKDVNFAMKK